MLSVQPIALWRYLSLRSSHILPDGVDERVYLSYEDALWDLIEVYEIAPGSIILVPDYWCLDVMSNCEAHGLRVETYQLDMDLQPIRQDLDDTLRRCSPRILVMFHAVGITCRLMSDKDWLQTLPSDLILIEDSVHSIIDPRELQIQREHHYVIDSWRKVMPLQGSSVYGRTHDMRRFTPTMTREIGYQLKVYVLWILMQLMFMVSALTRSIWAGRVAERLMMTGYDIIGHNDRSASIPRLTRIMRSHIDVSSIRAVKSRQAKRYLERLKQALTTITIPHIELSEYGYLRGLPVVLTGPGRQSAIDKMRVRGLMVRAELTGCAWTRDRSIIYLPLGPYLSDHDIDEVCDILRSVI